VRGLIRLLHILGERVIHWRGEMRIGRRQGFLFSSSSNWLRGSSVLNQRRALDRISHRSGRFLDPE
jgi:hypothetical protein